MSEKGRVILIGLDGFGIEEIGDWFIDKKFPNLGLLADNGTMTNLRSTHPPWTPCAWPSLLSGKNPGTHGCFDFFTHDNYQKKLINRNDVDSPYLTDIVDAYNLTPVVVNFPITHPVPEFENGAIIPGYLATEDTDFYPQGIRDEFENEFGSYQIYPEYGAKKKAVNEYTTVAQCRRDMARFLDQRYDWNLLAVQFQVTDSIFHDLEDHDQIRRILEKVDQFVGDIISLGDDSTDVFVVSDHGMGDYDWSFYVNSWLVNEGYAQTTVGEEQYLREIKVELKGEDINAESSVASRSFSALINLLSEVGLTPKRVHQVLSTAGLDKFVELILPEEILIAAQNQVIDYPNSVAYQMLFNSLGISLNVEGRDPSGIVSPDEYEPIRSEIMEKLKRIRDPDGEFVFDGVYPKEKIYHGPHLDDAPDILLIPRDYRYDISGSVIDTFRRNPHKNHKPEGILVTNRELNVGENEASIYDIAPTVAASLNLPVDSQTDGKVLKPYKETEERVDWEEIAGDYRKQKSSTTEESQNIEDRLADLGYME